MLHLLDRLGTIRVAVVHMFSPLLVSVGYSQNSDGPKMLDTGAEGVSGLCVLTG